MLSANAGLVPVAFVAVTVSGNEPVTVGVPEITPVPVANPNPAGNVPEAMAKLVGTFVAVIVKLNGCPPLPLALVALFTTGAPRLMLN